MGGKHDFIEIVILKITLQCEVSLRYNFQTFECKQDKLNNLITLLKLEQVYLK
jgi:hypothetical protein